MAVQLEANFDIKLTNQVGGGFGISALHQVRYAEIDMDDIRIQTTYPYLKLPSSFGLAWGLTYDDGLASSITIPIEEGR